METPPPLPPQGSPPNAPITNAHDQQLLDRARNAGRNLAVLATLATLVALGLLSAGFFSKDAPRMVVAMALPLTLLAAGYWILAVAARRGNPTAVGVVIVAAVVQMCLVLILAGVNAARHNTPFQPPIAGMIIPILVLFALNSSRDVLMKLKERNLWDRVFGSAKPSASLCVIGGMFFVTGIVAFNGGTYYISWKAEQQQKAEFQHARAFIEMLKTDEKQLLGAMPGVLSNPTQRNLEAILNQLKGLQDKLEALKTESASFKNLLQILHTYGNALRQWKSGLTLLTEPIPDTHRAQKMFQLGDKLKVDALQEFDRRYAPKKPQPSNPNP
jgi:Tfp pilus assembly protein PilN